MMVIIKKIYVLLLVYMLTLDHLMIIHKLYLA